MVSAGVEMFHCNKDDSKRYSHDNGNIGFPFHYKVNYFIFETRNHSVWIDTRTLSVHQMQPARGPGGQEGNTEQVYTSKKYTPWTRDMNLHWTCTRQFFQLSSKTTLWTYCFCFRTYYITHAS